MKLFEKQLENILLLIEDQDLKDFVTSITNLAYKEGFFDGMKEETEEGGKE